MLNQLSHTDLRCLALSYCEYGNDDSQALCMLELEPELYMCVCAHVCFEHLVNVILNIWVIAVCKLIDSCLEALGFWRESLSLILENSQSLLHTKFLLLLSLFFSPGMPVSHVILFVIVPQFLDTFIPYFFILFFFASPFGT